jgi:predicted amino acid dehydrogenase
VGGAWQRINAAIRRALEDVTLQQLAGLDVAPGRASSVSFNLDIRRQAS